MKDFEGNELTVGDTVIFIYSNTTGGKKLMRGVIESIEKGLAYIKDMSYSCYDNDPSITERWNLSTGYTNQVKVKGTSIYKIS